MLPESAADSAGPRTKLGLMVTRSILRGRHFWCGSGGRRRRGEGEREEKNREKEKNKTDDGKEEKIISLPPLGLGDLPSLFFRHGLGQVVGLAVGDRARLVPVLLRVERALFRRRGVLAVHRRDRRGQHDPQRPPSLSLLALAAFLLLLLAPPLVLLGRRAQEVDRAAEGRVEELALRVGRREDEGRAGMFLVGGVEKRKRSALRLLPLLDAFSLSLSSLSLLCLSLYLSIYLNTGLTPRGR